MRVITIATFAIAVLLVISAIIGSGHVVFAMFSNSGNNQETQQWCGNSCNVSSSNMITTGSSGGGLTSPSPTPTPTTLTLRIGVPGLAILSVFLTTNAGQGIGGATVTFTAKDSGGNVVPFNDIHGNPLTAKTDSTGEYQASPNVNDLAGAFTITAHYAGQPPQLAPSDSKPQVNPRG